jgi:hypothetical protein
MEMTMKAAAKIEDVMKAYIEETGLTHEEFCNEITSSLKNTTYSRVSVTNWVNGKSSPSTDFLLVCAVVYKNWVRSWATACLKVKLPEVFETGAITFYPSKE